MVGRTNWSQKTNLSISRMIAGGSPGATESFPPKCLNDPQNIANHELQQQNVKLINEINVHLENYPLNYQKNE